MIPFNRDRDDSSRVPEAVTIRVTGDREEPVPEGESGKGLLLETTRGDIHCILHEATEETGAAVVWVGGGRGGFLGPGDGLYPVLAEELASQGITSLRLNYRHAGDLDESTLDLLAGVAYLSLHDRWRTAVVGHSFGGGVVLSAARYTKLIAAAVTLAGQTDGAEDVMLLSPRPLLLVHGEEDTVLPVDCIHMVYDWAFEPKEKVIFPGAGHGLRECREELHALLARWLSQKLLSR